MESKYLAPLLLFLFIPIAFATYSVGVQPSYITLYLAPNFPNIILPLRLWNSGDESVNFTVEVSDNLYEFTTFRNTSVYVPAHSNITYNYREVDITFKKTSGNKTVDGFIYVYAKPSGGMIAVVPRVLVKIYIVQTETPAFQSYSFTTPQINQTQTTTTTTQQQQTTTTKPQPGLTSANITITNTTNTTNTSQELPFFWKIILMVAIVVGFSLLMFLVVRVIYFWY